MKLFDWYLEFQENIKELIMDSLGIRDNTKYGVEHMRIRSKVEAIKKRFFKSELKKLVKKHGKVMVIFSDSDGHRKRLIKEDGSCTVSYKGDGYRRWSGFGLSCFMSYTEDEYRHNYDYWDDYRHERVLAKKGKKKTLNNTIDALVSHDKGENVHPVEIRYGRTFKKVLFVIENY
jgi:hypothetical protein